MGKDNLVVGVDVGGSHITAGIVDLSNKSIVKESILRQRVNCHAPANDILDTWAGAIQQVIKNARAGICRVGFAMPGPFDYQSGISLITGFDKYEALYGLDIRTALAEKLQLLPRHILFRNDAEAFLEGELFCGAGIGFQNAIGITLGTGLGSAVKKNGIAKDAERSVIDYHGEMIEASVSTRGIVRNYFNLTGQKVKDGKAVADLYDVDTAAQQAYGKFGADLAWFLTGFINDENPDLLIIGGNIANSRQLFLPAVTGILAQRVERMPEIKIAELGEAAALIGGACLFSYNVNNEIKSA